MKSILIQAGAELCQAQVELGLTMLDLLSNKLGFSLFFLMSSFFFFFGRLPFYFYFEVVFHLIRPS